MKIKDICGKATGLFYKGMREFKNDLPTFLMFEGAALVGAGAIMLIHDADDISKVNIDRQESKQEIKDVDADPEGWSQMGETKKEYKRRKRKEHFKGYVKAVGPGVLIMAVGEFMQFKAEATTKKRLETSVIQLVALSTLFNNYRQRNIEDQGAEKDYEYMTGQKIVHEKVVDHETGEEKEKIFIDPATLKEPVAFGFVFDKSNDNWTDNIEHNINTISNGIVDLNRQLTINKHLFARDMYEKFGATPDTLSSNAGALYDWTEGYDDKGEPIITTSHLLRIRPEGLQGLINGMTPNATIIFEYDDGTPLHIDIRNKIGWNTIAQVNNPYSKES